MHPEPLFWNVTLYGLMIAIGLLIAFGILLLYSKKKGVDENFVDFIFYVSIATVLFGFLSARFFQELFNYLKDPSQGFHLFREGGITFLGGFVGGAGCFLALYFLFGRKYKFNSNLLDLISILPCCILVGHAFGRIGCFFAGCCYGKPASGFFSFLGVQFPQGTAAYSGGVPVYPTQLFESAFLFADFAVTSFLFLKKNFRYNLPVYLISYGVFRFLIEFLRGDERGESIFHLFSPSQGWSILLIVAGIGTIFLLKWLFKISDKKKQEREAEEKANGQVAAQKKDGE